MILLELLPGEDKGMEQRKIEAKIQSLPIHQSCCGPFVAGSVSQDKGLEELEPPGPSEPARVKKM